MDTLDIGKGDGIKSIPSYFGSNKEEEEDIPDMDTYEDTGDNFVRLAWILYLFFHKKNLYLLTGLSKYDNVNDSSSDLADRRLLLSPHTLLQKSLMTTTFSELGHTMLASRELFYLVWTVLLIRFCTSNHT
jgi:hypothetical protein